jgi:deazaflavin-dependent oxidoreductase (nitroreductase family)
MAAIRRTKAVEFAWRAHRWIYRVSGGRIWTRMGGMPILLLTTTGRKSGEPRPVALQHLRDEDAFVVIASHAGEPTHPAWFLNLQANPEATVQVQGKITPVRFREAEGEERERLWTQAVAVHPAYEEYRGRVERRIPVVVLEPR